MGESGKSKTKQLLQQGLDHYGGGEFAEAFQAWNAVLALDPHNAEALDYMESADRRSQRTLPAKERMSDAARRIVFEANILLDQNDLESAFDLLIGGAESASLNLGLEATLELVRSGLFRQYREKIGDLGSVPTLRKDPCDMAKFNLPADAGFMLSLMDGSTSLADLISLSGMDAFAALRIVQQLLDAEIVGLSP
jgi:hypothetical protein